MVAWKEEYRIGIEKLTSSIASFLKLQDELMTY